MAQRGNGFNINGSGRGGWRGCGRGRGGGQASRGRPNTPRRNGRGRGARPMYNNLDIIDVDIQRYAEDQASSGTASPSPGWRRRGGYRGRGRSRGTTTPLNLVVFNNGRTPPPPPRQEDWDTKAAARGPSRGLGAAFNRDMPLSKLLALDRPYLRPINFVPAQLTPVLFEREEELIEVHEFKEPEDHVPTADQVSRVFTQQMPQAEVSDSFFQDPVTDLSAHADSEPVTIVDFASVGKLLDDTSTQPTVTFGEVSNLTISDTLEDAPDNQASIFNEIMRALAIDPKEFSSIVLSNPGQERDKNVANTSSHHFEGAASMAKERDSMSLMKAQNANDTAGAELPIFVVDANSSEAREQQTNIKYSSAISSSQALGSTLHDEDEVIVYDAPLPRSGRTTPSILPIDTQCRREESSSSSATYKTATSGTSKTFLEASSSADISSTTNGYVDTVTGAFAGLSFSFDAIAQVTETNRLQTTTPRARRLTKRDRKSRVATSKAKKRNSFGNFGAMLEEIHLHDDELGLNGTRGKLEGSDIDWGDGSDSPDAVEAVSNKLGGMDIDGDIDEKATQSFVNGMNNKGMEYTRIDDIEDARKLRLEDEEETQSSSDDDVDSEVEAVLKAEEQRLVGQASGTPESDHDEAEIEDDEDGDISSGDGETPTRTFQSRLNQARQRAKGKGKMPETAFTAAHASGGDLFGRRISELAAPGREFEEESDDSDDSDDDFDANFTWTQHDDDFVADIQDLLDDEDDRLLSDRKQRKALFKAVLNGEFSSTPAKKRRDYGKDLPPELHAQWERDRAKKAENKRKRAEARLQVAADPFAQHKGGKKGRKAMLRAARLAEEAREDGPLGPSITVIIEQIRKFVDDLSLTGPLALPPMDKDSRKQVHDIAQAFGLKSQSKGKGAARYTTLTKTSRTGVQMNERKIQRIIRINGEQGFSRPGGGKGRGTTGAPKHKEGDEVGKAAPKIGDSNIGFRMLAQMGWIEGEKIGVSGGLDVPLKAVIKNSKLGLGATR